MNRDAPALAVGLDFIAAVIDGNWSTLAMVITSSIETTSQVMLSSFTHKYATAPTPGSYTAFHTYFGTSNLPMGVAPICRQCSRKMAGPVGGVVHQFDALDPVFRKHCTSRWPSHVTQGTAMELPIAL